MKKIIACMMLGMGVMSTVSFAEKLPSLASISRVLSDKIAAGHDNHEDKGPIVHHSLADIRDVIDAKIDAGHDDHGDNDDEEHGRHNKHPILY
jgi:hypothetical protein